MVIAEDIETELWHEIMDLLTKDNWEIIYIYDGMDAGIDFSAYTLKKGEEKLFFEWTNYFEGEIKCRSVDRLVEIEKLIGQKLKIKEEKPPSNSGDNQK